MCLVYGAANDNDIIVTPKFSYANCQTETNHARKYLCSMVQQHGTHFVIVYRILLLLLFLFSVGGGDDGDAYACLYVYVWLFDALHHHHWIQYTHIMCVSYVFLSKLPHTHTHTFNPPFVSCVWNTHHIQHKHTLENSKSGWLKCIVGWLWLYGALWLPCFVYSFQRMNQNEIRNAHSHHHPNSGYCRRRCCCVFSTVNDGCTNGACAVLWR